MVYNFAWPYGFLDVQRHISGNGEKITFDGFMVAQNGDVIPAYEFGVQTIWHIKVMGSDKDILANATVNNPGRYGNSVTIHIYVIGDDGTIRQLDGYAQLKVEFDGEGE